MTETSQIAKPYSILAEVYDQVMAKVDYELWADFIDEIIATHHPTAKTVLELACGTGSLTFELQKIGYRISGADKVAAMVQKAQDKAAFLNSDAQFKQADFLDIQLSETFDIIVAIFDSVNYLLHEQELLQMFGQVQKLMKKDSLFIFDFTTPLNSIESLHFLNERNGSTQNGYRYFRKSRYDEEQQIHYNTFEIEKLADDDETVLTHFTEEHKQRTYTLEQMLNILEQTPFTVKARYGEFDMTRANRNSRRITMVLKLNKSTSQ